jgi:MarR family 2-MHQ and catechol resistance regulon transcriptional repressor
MTKCPKGIFLDIKVYQAYPAIMKIKEHSGPHLWLSLWKASRAITEFDKCSIAASGFTNFSDFAVLEVLMHKGALPVNAIGAKVMLTSGSATTAVDRLQRKGLVARQRSEADGRVVEVALTGEGRRLIESAFEAHAQRLEELFSVLTAAEKVELARLSQRVGRQAEALLKTPEE